MRTNIPGVWAIGDCIGDPRAPKLAHVASAQGEVAVDTILGEDAVMSYDVTPNVVYTHPEIAQVGLTEEQAKEKYGAEVKAARYSFRASGRALALGEADGLTKIITAGKDQRIVGVHIVGPQASELIAEATLAMRLEATVEDVIATIHAHPTLAETFREAALVRMPVRQNILVIVAAVLAPAALVEPQRGVAGVHHAVGADLIGSAVHRISNVRGIRIARQAGQPRSLFNPASRR